MKNKLILSLLASFMTCAPAFAVDRINVSEPPYNAIPNDGIDDTAGVTAALAAGTSIYFPPGTYNLTGRIPIPAGKAYRIYGDGPGVSVLSWTAGTSGGGGFNASNLGINTLNVEGLSFIAATPMTNSSAGIAIYAAFSDPNGSSKFHTATIHNVVIAGIGRDGNTSGYWNTGISLSRAQNAVIDKVDISGRVGLTAAGIVWSSPTDTATTGIEISNAEIKFCNVGVQTSGWVEGFYMNNFEVVFCGQPPSPVFDLKASTSTSVQHLPTFILSNGSIDMIGDGVKMNNLSAIKIANVDFMHTSDAAVDGTFVNISNTIGASISGCSFTSKNGGIANENGIFLTNTTLTRISGNLFRSLNPSSTGSAIVAYTGSDVVRITDNIFKTVARPTDNAYGATNFYYDADNFVQP